MFRVGLNPYGLTYTVGLQAAGTPRANPRAIGLRGFIEVTRDFGAQVIELDDRWLTPMSDSDLERLRDELAGLGMATVCSSGLTHQPNETLAAPIRCARAIGARLIRLGLNPVLEGARASWGSRWDEMVRHARQVLKSETPRAADAGLVIALEDHQDFGSEELVEMAEEAGESAGVVLDTGNPFAVGEDPVAFTQRAASRIRHVHLKDYRAQFTDAGYRLVRCAIGDGCVPFQAIAAVLESHHQSLTASIEPGALEARHIRAFDPEWWRGYRPRRAEEFGVALGRLRQKCLGDDEDYRTPWERDAPGPEIIEYELAQIRQSVGNIRTWTETSR